MRRINHPKMDDRRDRVSLEKKSWDRAAWFTLTAAREKIITGQVGFLEELGRLELTLTKPLG